MVEINLFNVEELIFLDKKVQKQIPEFFHLFEQYRLSKMTPALRLLGKRSVMEFLQGLKDEHLEILEGYFGNRVTLSKTDHHIVKNLVFSLDSTELGSMKGTEGYPNFCCHRDGNQVYLSFWR